MKRLVNSDAETQAWTLRKRKRKHNGQSIRESWSIKRIQKVKILKFKILGNQ